MGKVNYKKLYRSIKLYPIFYGLTADLIFWIAINTLFLTTVKHLSASQINSIEAIGTAVGLIFQLFLIKIVRKIGNLNSVRLGTILLFLSVLLDTIST
jgi:tetrahydromethanopterin S-methyltransferase subunit G